VTALLAHARARLAALDHALARIAAGDRSFGRCEACGATIPPERLEAVPDAVRCVDCAAELRKDGRRWR
jgi:DnaK suppressor protein